METFNSFIEAFPSYKKASFTLVFVVWAASNFMSHPTLAALFMSVIVVLPMLFILVWVAHFEGIRTGWKDAEGHFTTKASPTGPKGIHTS